MICPVDLTRRLVQIDTVNPPGRERHCIKMLGFYLENAGFEVAFFEFEEERTSLVARVGNGSGLPICFTGHVDTVPLGNKPWSVDPFEGAIVGDKLYGRGASDMKSGVAAFICAALDLVDELREGPGVVLIVTASEETGCQGARHLVEVGDALGGAGAVIVGEMTANQPVIGHKGAIWLDVSSAGVASHGSTPEKGVNAVYRAARLTTKLEEYGFNFPPHGTLGGPTINVGRISGGTGINTVPDVATIGVDIRTVPGMEASNVRDNLIQYLGEEVAAVSTLLELDPVWTDPGHEWVTQVVSTVRRHTGHNYLLKGASFFTDACALNKAYPNAPIVVLGPGEPDQAHRTDEFCLVPRIKTATEIYKDLMRAWNGVSAQSGLLYAD